MKLSFTLFISLTFIITTNAQEISFAPAQTNPFGLADAGGSVRPVFVDIDNDGDLDCFDGLENGQTAYFNNNEDAFVPSFGQWTNANLFGIIDVGLNSSPSFVDIDNDNKADAFVGNPSDNILGYENVGNKNFPIFNLPEENPFGLTNVIQSATPTFADIDNDGRDDCFVSNTAGDIYYFRNTSVVSVENELNSAIVEIKAYPNSVSLVMNINTTNNIKIEDISVYNILGQRINVNANNSANLISLDFSSLTQGIYLLAVKNNKLNFITNVIKTGRALR